MSFFPSSCAIFPVTPWHCILPTLHSYKLCMCVIIFFCFQGQGAWENIFSASIDWAGNFGGSPEVKLWKKSFILWETNELWNESGMKFLQATSVLLETNLQTLITKWNLPDIPVWFVFNSISSTVWCSVPRPYKTFLCFDVPLVCWNSYLQCSCMLGLSMSNSCVWKTYMHE